MQNGASSVKSWNCVTYLFSNFIPLAGCNPLAQCFQPGGHGTFIGKCKIELICILPTEYNAYWVHIINNKVPKGAIGRSGMGTTDQTEHWCGVHGAKFILRTIKKIIYISTKY